MSSNDDEDDEEEYITYGKLLDPIQEDEVVKKVNPDHQFVKDENGLRRFHGAFQGGFSAGYYNTVGSFEGWTPSTFKSSRSSKSVTISQNAYDFMDEEDKKDLGVDASSLKIKSEYNNYSSRKRKYPEIDTGPIPGKPVLGEILKPIPNTWGFELLTSMGWRPGQGVGPQVTQREKRQTEKELLNFGMKYYTNVIYNDNDDNDDDDKNITNLLYNNIKVSPYEYESVVLKPKFDTFGLGYESLQKPITSLKSIDTYSKLTIDGKSIHGQAFGVGVYENDTDDIYKTEDLSNYDFSLDDKSQKSRPKFKSNFNSNCIENFIENGSVKNNLFENFHSTIEIPAEWRPQGLFNRILGQFSLNSCNQFSIPPNISTMNINTQKSELFPSIEKFDKKEMPNILSEIISDRFTRAVLSDDSTNALIPVARTSDSELDKFKSYAIKKEFGFWTRKTESWTPDKLLCKRFNVPVPKQPLMSTNDGKKQETRSLFNSLQFPLDQIQNTKSLAINDVNEEQFTLKDDKISEQECPTEKPSVDFFKAIFLENNDDDNFNDKKLTEPIIKDNSTKEDNSTEIPLLNKETVKSNILPKGIFTNLNFEDLFSTSSKDYVTKIDNENKLYGPVLPENKNLNTNSTSIKNIETSYAEDEWVEKTPLSKESVNRKNKHKMHKKKHKKKKSHKHR